MVNHKRIILKMRLIISYTKKFLCFGRVPLISFFLFLISFVVFYVMCTIYFQIGMQMKKKLISCIFGLGGFS